MCILYTFDYIFRLKNDYNQINAPVLRAHPYHPHHPHYPYHPQILMNSDAPLSISQLAGRFGSRSFTLEMRAASGGNEPGLRKFLLQYPSLWLPFVHKPLDFINEKGIRLNELTYRPTRCVKVFTRLNADFLYFSYELQK